MNETSKESMFPEFTSEFAGLANARDFDPSSDRANAEQQRPQASASRFGLRCAEKATTWIRDATQQRSQPAHNVQAEADRLRDNTRS